MEDTAMIKKEYIMPEIEVYQVQTQLQMLAGSLTGVTTNGLDDDEEEDDDEIKYDPNNPQSGNPWGNAW